ncbi:hypothetical protein JR316_0007791 [Psilocybe cubensis]|uniref:Uncharacterized protein n=2 Tax=Psilocybe cubensis TaxID=181762 RepID=A0ACB8GUP1_PSICU|nr:hypothetical protein JR316_0007791 [Psilocybe cubensis]KAH9479205.1 hypothetical protein JR316_0007791 [Psilocybe cubensis]
MPDLTKIVDKAKQYIGLVKLFKILVFGILVFCTTIFGDVIEICRVLNRWVLVQSTKELHKSMVEGVSYEQLREERVRRTFNVKMCSQNRESRVVIEGSIQENTNVTIGELTREHSGVPFALHLRRSRLTQPRSPVLPATELIVPYDV